MHGWACAALIAQIALYLFFFRFGLSAASRRERPEQAITAVIGAYGLVQLCYIISRSISGNLFHSAVPAVLLATLCAQQCYCIICRALGKDSESLQHSPQYWTAVRLACYVWFSISVAIATRAYTYPGVVGDLAANVFTAREKTPVALMWPAVQQRQAAICGLIRKYSERGRRVAVIADVETWSLLETGLRPVFRLSPCYALLFTREDMAAAATDITNAEVNTLIIQNRGGLDYIVPADTWTTIQRDLVPALPGFELVDDIDGISIYMKRDAD
jgi:hypothetical protein